VSHFAQDDKFEGISRIKDFESGRNRIKDLKVGGTG
jgi:hypothetical protein